ncbi:unnamed protein product [Chilo suppressalis]|uniref:PiggyBac transposable element-derived protein 4 C-terminal zinc-ribbon domain-containing protein n=1 Tax=Chilo suppressalis TaxID=168631 RepID=A0ABN8B2J6_CHISP|nr:unnamed protein product [Chilo suppressalis]
MTLVPQRTRPYIEGNHIPAPTGWRSTRCWLCILNKKTARPAYKCNGNLCILGCFRVYHKPPST